MNMTPPTAELIRRRIEQIPAGEPFTPAGLLECGTRASIDQSLSRMVKAGLIERVTRGVFVRPEVSRYAGKVMPEPVKVAEALARSTGAVVQVHGAEAARRLGLTTQVPMQPVFTTSGPSRRIKFGQLEIRLQHASPRKLALAGRPAGLALAALWYLGKGEVSPGTLEQVRRKLPSGEFDALRSATHAMPAWMSDVFYRHEHTRRHD